MEDFHVTIPYGLVVLAGGVAGYLKRGSAASLAAGSDSARRCSSPARSAPGPSRTAGVEPALSSAPSSRSVRCLLPLPPLSFLPSSLALFACLLRRPVLFLMWVWRHRRKPW
ncbi:hypothetical protein PAHAL_2G389300 [Panicum hallii]|uniref:Uncharacterized protein n=1 Tax=Panicum hallii TaxID=206008 RepID=A0A2S3H1S6_9POAL|nr:hypothetical protein PAHAL_2G389300 [Panicum hallii]